MLPDVPHSPSNPSQRLFRHEALAALNSDHTGAALFNFPRTLSMPAAVLFLGLFGFVAVLWSAEFTHAIRVSGTCCSVSGTQAAATGGVLYIPAQLRQFVQVGDPVIVRFPTGAQVEGAITLMEQDGGKQALLARTVTGDQARYAVVAWQLVRPAGSAPFASKARNQGVVASVSIRAGFLQWAINLLSDDRKRS